MSSYPSDRARDGLVLRDGLALPLMLMDSPVSILGSSSSGAPAAPTLTTPTLTPTTLRNIEQMFLDSCHNVEECRPPDQHANAARFEPPAVSLHDIQIKREWVLDHGASALPGPHSNDKPPPLHLLPPIVVPPPPSIERLLPTEPVPCSAIVTTSNNNNHHHHHQGLTILALPSNPVNGLTTSPPALELPPQTSKRKRSSSSNGGGRKSSSSSSNMTPDEEHRKRLRRQRNKEAAARCRKRRLDQTVTLQDEVDRWEAKKADMQEEIKGLEVQKRDLEVLLKLHRAECKARAKRTVIRETVSQVNGIKQEKDYLEHSS